MFGRIRTRNPKFIKKKKRHQNSYVWKRKNKIVSNDTARIPRYTGIGAQFQCF